MSQSSKAVGLCESSASSAASRASRASYLAAASRREGPTPQRQRTAFYQGWLQKKAIGKSSLTLVKTWKSRYFVLLDRELRWYESADVDQAGNSFIKGKQKGKLSISPEVTLEHDTKLSKGAWGFTVTSSGASLVLQAKDLQDRNAWLAALSVRVGSPLGDSGPREPALSLATLELSSEQVSSDTGWDQGADDDSDTEEA